jgi:hypothetical protein
VNVAGILGDDFSTICINFPCPQKDFPIGIEFNQANNIEILEHQYDWLNWAAPLARRIGRVGVPSWI